MEIDDTVDIETRFDRLVLLDSDMALVIRDGVPLLRGGEYELGDRIPDDFLVLLAVGYSFRIEEFRALALEVVNKLAELGELDGIINRATRQ